ncbi:hypothetical protein DFH09DRAFT_1334457 [Mycena vulgaris]|nr:hypothetical protein DFH09DRAFT_1334457 [Mycena vulgaris]
MHPPPHHSLARARPRLLSTPRSLFPPAPPPAPPAPATHSYPRPPVAGCSSSPVQLHPHSPPPPHQHVFSHSWHISSSTYLSVARTPSTARLILASLLSPSQNGHLPAPAPASVSDVDERAKERRASSPPRLRQTRTPASRPELTQPDIPFRKGLRLHVKRMVRVRSLDRPPQMSLVIPPPRIYQALISTEFRETVARIPVQIHILSPTPSSSTAPPQTLTQVRIDEQLMPVHTRSRLVDVSYYTHPTRFALIRHHHDLLLRAHTNQPAAAPLPPSSAGASAHTLFPIRCSHYPVSDTSHPSCCEHTDLPALSQQGSGADSERANASADPFPTPRTCSLSKARPFGAPAIPLATPASCVAPNRTVELDARRAGAARCSAAQHPSLGTPVLATM